MTLPLELDREELDRLKKLSPRERLLSTPRFVEGVRTEPRLRDGGDGVMTRGEPRDSPRLVLVGTLDRDVPRWTFSFVRLRVAGRSAPRLLAGVRGVTVDRGVPVEGTDLRPVRSLTLPWGLGRVVDRSVIVEEGRLGRAGV